MTGSPFGLTYSSVHCSLSRLVSYLASSKRLLVSLPAGISDRACELLICRRGAPDPTRTNTCMPGSRSIQPEQLCLAVGSFAALVEDALAGSIILLAHPMTSLTHGLTFLSRDLASRRSSSELLRTVGRLQSQRAAKLTCHSRVLSRHLGGTVIHQS